MSQANGSPSKFVYVTYIRTTPEKLWEALTAPEFTRQYWFGHEQESTWQPGTPWKMLKDGKLMDTGEIEAAEPPHLLRLRWRNEYRPELTQEGFSRATYQLDPWGDTVKLTVTHEIDVAESKFITAVSGGWPMVLSNLKSLLETGQTPVVRTPLAA
jgi:uncharacterized protein YndB with AHSA1/START domain